MYILLVLYVHGQYSIMVQGFLNNHVMFTSWMFYLWFYENQKIIQVKEKGSKKGKKEIGCKAWLVNRFESKSMVLCLKHAFMLLHSGFEKFFSHVRTGTDFLCFETCMP